MRLAIMQPYFFPYLGYWQLIHAVDRFVFYDDVNYIKQGWINRNRVIVNGQPSYITVPIKDASPYKKINELFIDNTAFRRDKMLKTIDAAYRRAPHFLEAMPIVESIIFYQAKNLSDYVKNSIYKISNAVGITTEIVNSSSKYENKHITAQDRILDICIREHADTYINPQGGQNLYEAKVFYRRNIDLQFLIMRPVKYKQKSDEFIPYMSIIDPLMQIGLEGVSDYLNEYDLMPAGVRDGD
jgi:hypothetical protein